MIEIIPALLSKNFAELQEALGRVVGAARVVQVDVVDGIFAPNKTWPYGDEARFEKICMGDEGLPLWDEFDFQFDLMLEHPEAEVLKFIDAGAASVIIHAKSAGAKEALELVAQKNAEAGDDLQTSVGLALLPTAQPADLEAFAGLYDFVQVMGIDRVGFQGQAFDEKASTLVKEIHGTYPDLILQVDGSVNAGDIGALVQAGANRFVVGSAIFAAPDAKKALTMLQAAVY